MDDEYQQKYSFRLLDITEKISDAIKIIGATPSKELEELEDETEQIKAEAAAIKQDNYGFGISTGTASNNRASYCLGCGSNGPWNGVMCMNCGLINDD